MKNWKFLAPSLKKLEIFSSLFEKLEIFSFNQNQLLKKNSLKNWKYLAPSLKELEIFSSFFENIGNFLLLPNSITKKKRKKEIALKKLEKVFEKIGKKSPFFSKGR